MSNNETTCELNIAGMDCASCAGKIEKGLKSINGVKDVSVNFGAGKAKVSFNPASVNLEKIKKGIESLGYKVKENEKDEGNKETLDIIRMAVVGILILIGWSGILSPLIRYDIASIIAALIGGYPLVKKAFIDLKTKTITADVFMALGVVAAAIIGEFLSSAVIAFFMLIAEYLDKLTMDKARRALYELIKLSPKSARIVKDGREIEIAIEEIKKGDVVIVRPGERIPVDGRIVEGSSFVNQATITGESMPVEKGSGDEVYSATINDAGLLKIKAIHAGADTTLAKIIHLVEEAESAKAPVQRIADKFAAYFTPAILLIAGLTFLISGNFIYAIAVIVVACPCTVAIATPLAIVAGTGKAARKGIIIKGGIYLEALAKIDTVVMDKTGTITIGEPRITDIKAFAEHNEDEILTMAAAVERYSEHPLSKAIIKKAEDEGIHIPEPQDFQIIPGQGVMARYNGTSVLLGSRELLKGGKVTLTAEIEAYMKAREEEGKTALLISHDSEVCGVIAVSDVVRKESIEAIKEIKDAGIKNIIMLTGDNWRTARAIAGQVGIDNVEAELMPEDKVKKVQELLSKGRKVAMVGDGINDAPALAMADVGIAMGVAGTDVAIEAADVALMRDDWRQIPEAIRIGRKTFGVIKQNLAIGIVFNIIGVSLAATGVLTPMMAAVAHVLPDVIVFANSARVIR
ncbi:MAG: cadmium-translocating P-type ATPase [Nitrospirae bacterium]|nr:cadmium-translocating P-type ATPase [Nitrospirota bacterium]